MKTISENLKRGTLELLVLSLLDKQDMYGYEICRTITEKSDRQFIVLEGSLYTILYRLGQKGYISDRKELVGTRRTRVYYHLEPAGKEYYEEFLNEYNNFVEGVSKVLGK